MIIVLEDILKNVIETQLSTVKTNTDIINRVFTSPALNEFKTFISKNSIKVIKGFPREPAVLPCYCIILGQESEIPEGLGDYIDSDLEDSEVNIGNKIDEILTVEHDHILGNFVRIASVPLNRVISITETDDFYVLNYQLGLIGISDENINPGDSLTISYEYFKEETDYYGILTNNTYRIECWSENADLTIYMYYLLKWILLKERNTLTNSGMILPSLNGNDFEPVPEYFAHFVFRRTMNVSCKVESTYSIGTGLVQEINVDIIKEVED
jgi:hypothetical protein